MSEVTDGPQYVARYMRRHASDCQEFDTLDDAVAFLSESWDADELHPTSVVGPDGTVLLEGDALMNALRNHPQSAWYVKHQN